MRPRGRGRDVPRSTSCVRAESTVHESGLQARVGSDSGARRRGGVQGSDSRCERPVARETRPFRSPCAGPRFYADSSSEKSGRASQVTGCCCLLSSVCMMHAGECCLFLVHMQVCFCGCVQGTGYSKRWPSDRNGTRALCEQQGGAGMPSSRRNWNRVRRPQRPDVRTCSSDKNQRAIEPK